MHSQYIAALDFHDYVDFLVLCLLTLFVVYMVRLFKRDE